MSPDIRLKLGIALLILGQPMPLGIALVVGTDWPAGVKTVVSGALLLGPEVLMVAAVALMGKENFNRIVAWIKGRLTALRPAGNVSLTRYVIGLVLFVGSILFSWIASYVPSLMPDESALRIAANLGLDLTFGVSLFVLGGDFWDKLQALFLYRARAVFPPAAST